MDEEIKGIVKSSVVTATLLYTFITLASQNKSKDEFDEEVVKWLEDCADNLARSLDKAGYVIAKKEPAFKL